MRFGNGTRAWVWLSGLFVLSVVSAVFGATEGGHVPAFPPALASYGTSPNASLGEALAHRIHVEPFNLVASAIFLMAIIHTFMAPMFLRLAHRFEHRHHQRLSDLGRLTTEGKPGEVSFWAEIFHFLGEIEAIFGIWVVPLLITLALQKGWPVARDYLGHGVNFTEPMFVMVIMTIAASRPVLEISERLMAVVASLGRGSPAAWWVSVLTVGPVLGSFITEPAAMTISALLLSQKFFERSPSPRFAYATLGLLFVNVSVGGTLTHFAAPPVLMVAGRWDWGIVHMFTHFGWKAVLGILVANLVYLVVFWREFRAMNAVAQLDSSRPKPVNREPVPAWIITVHVFFLAWTVLNNHFPALFIGGFLFYMAFTKATEHHQSELALRPALLVGFFLAGLVVHGGLQGWWIGPVLVRLGELPLFFGAVFLTAFNDNAAITYLATLVPSFSEELRYAIVSGAVVGGGLTVIANAPNPAGQSILGRFFPDGVSPLKLFLGALAPTVIVGAAFLVFR